MKNNKVKGQAIINTKSDHQSEKSLSKSRKVIFTILMLAIPFLFFISIEGGLRLFNYGGNLDLFVLDSASHSTEYVLNKNFTKRYFFKKGIKTPTPISQRFTAQKEKQKYRIFCLGASTTQGFPYQPNAAFPAQMKNILSTLHPDRKIEVINCGITAITSHSVLDMAREIVEKHEPDLLVVYSGHNEFYGVLGQASNLVLVNNYSFINMFLKLQQSRLFLLLRDASVYFFGSHISDVSTAQATTSMERFASDKGITLNNDLFKRTEQHFRENLLAICELAKENKTDIILCNLVDNQKDLKPFSAIKNADDLESKEKNNFFLLEKAESIRQAGQYQQAVSILGEIIKDDSSDAASHFYLGQAYRDLQLNELAKKHFQLAKDYDQIRFRAPSSFNKIIKEVTSTKNVPLADVHSTFSEVAQDGLIGNNLLLEHVHPNFRGNYLIAKTIAKEMSRNGMIQNDWDWSKSGSETDYLAMCNLTTLDHEIANYTVFRLTSHWPFEQTAESISYKPFGTEQTAQIARQIINEKEINLVQSHLNLGEEYLAENELEKGLAEYKAALAIEAHCDIYNRIGPVYTKKAELAFRQDGDFQKADKYFKEGLFYFTEGIEHCPDHFQLNFNLGLLYSLRNDQLENALKYFERALYLNPEHKKSMQMIAKIHLNQNKFDSALRVLNRGLEYYPLDVDFYSDLGYLYALQNEYSEAENWLNKALALEPYHSKSQQILKQVKNNNQNKN